MLRMSKVVDAEKLDEKHWQLTRLTRKCRQLKEKNGKDQPTHWLEEMEVAWRRRRLSEVYRLSRLMARRCLGPKKRHYNRPTRK